MDIENNSLHPKKLYISENGEIFDRNKQKYNGLKCMVLGIKSYSSVYNGNEYTKNDALMLIESDNKFIVATIHIPSSVLQDDYIGFKLFHGNYNYFMRTITVIPYYNKFSIWFEDDEMIWITEKLKKDLEFICNNFK